MIDEERIRQGLAARGITAHVSAFAITGSTNDDAKGAAAIGLSAPALFIADQQTHGRGRGGHGWLSRPGEGILMSLLLRPDLAPASSAPLTLAVGLAIAEVLEASVKRPLHIKWPNDLLLDDKKIAGILVEGQIRNDRLASVVVGLGLNVHAETLPDAISAIATSLAMAGVASRDRSHLAVELAARIIDCTEQFSRRGLAPFLKGLRARDALEGKSVEVGEVRGIAEGIDDAGRLCIVRGGERIAVASGHVVRLAKYDNSESAPDPGAEGRETSLK